MAILRHLASSTTGLTLRDEFSLAGEDVTQAMAWALDTLMEDLRGRTA